MEPEAKDLLIAQGGKPPHDKLIIDLLDRVMEIKDSFEEHVSKNEAREIREEMHLKQLSAYIHKLDQKLSIEHTKEHEWIKAMITKEQKRGKMYDEVAIAAAKMFGVGLIIFIGASVWDNVKTQVKTEKPHIHKEESNGRP